MSLSRKIPGGVLLAFLACGAVIPPETAVWKVDPAMSLAQIQAVIDGARDNDTIRFTAGTYDFSTGPVSDWPHIAGALVVAGKSLKFVADKGAVLVGADSDIGSSGYGTDGIIAFEIANPADKDVSFKGFTFRKFLAAIRSGILISASPDQVFDVCGRDLTVQNCRFEEMHRYAVRATGLQRNAKFTGNTVVWSLRGGFSLDWWSVGVDHVAAQPAAGSIKIQNNKINARCGGVWIERGARITITNNDFDATGTNYPADGIWIEGGASAAKIVNNDIFMAYYGIGLESEKLQSGATLHTYPVTKCKIANNRINAIEGIDFDGPATSANKIMNNKITLIHDTWGYGIWLCGSAGDTFTNNTISGVGNEAISVKGFDDTATGGFAASPHHNIFKKNSVRNFVASDVDYSFDAFSHDNTAVGICPENAAVRDEGVNNRFTCLFDAGFPPASAAGAQVRPRQERSERDDR